MVLPLHVRLSCNLLLSEVKATQFYSLEHGVHRVPGTFVKRHIRDVVHSSVLVMMVRVVLRIKAFFMLVWAQKGTCSMRQPLPPHPDQLTH